jgi:NitT/TauT family transport system substrate-binding protein
MALIQSRRGFLSTLAMLTAARSFSAPAALATHEALETTTIRLIKSPAPCTTPLYVAEDFLRAEGFTDIRYLSSLPGAQVSAFARGELDFGIIFVPEIVAGLDRGDAVTVLAGVHTGCFELVGNEAIQTVGDLKGKSVGVQGLGSPPHLFTSLIAAHIGIDPVNDIRWVVSRSPRPVELFTAGKLDAFLSLPPDPMYLRARNIGHVVVDSIVDRPWSEYFCCMLAGNRDFVQNYPVATKRVVRAILKALEVCATDPARAAQQFLNRGFNSQYGYVHQTLSELPYDKWREYDPEDTLRFYALRMREVGFIKSVPQTIIADHTDWRFLEELKHELKA